MKTAAKRGVRIVVRIGVRTDVRTGARLGVTTDNKTVVEGIVGAEREGMIVVKTGVKTAISSAKHTPGMAS